MENKSNVRHNDDVIIEKLNSFRDLMEVKFASIEKEMAGIKAELEKRGLRISALEMWQANFLGKLSLISVIIGLGVSFLFNWVGKHF